MPGESRKTADAQALLPKTYSQRIEELEADVRKLREQLSTVIMPEIELRAAMRLTPDSYWDWLLHSIKTMPSSPEQLHWIGFLVRLHHDIQRGTISSHLIADLYTTLLNSRNEISYLNDQHKFGVEDAYKTIFTHFDKFLSNYPRLQAQVKAIIDE